MEVKEIEKVMYELHKKLLNKPTGKEWQYNKILKEEGVDIL